MKLIKPSQLSFNTWNSVELLQYLCRKLIFLTNHPRWSLHSRIHIRLYSWHLCKAYPRLGEIQQQVYVILVRNSLQKRLVEIISTWLHIWYYMSVNGSKWVYMKAYEVILWYMNVYESVWMYMRQCDDKWKYMIVYECKW